LLASTFTPQLQQIKSIFFITTFFMVVPLVAQNALDDPMQQVTSSSPSSSEAVTSHNFSGKAVEITADGNTHFENGTAFAEENVQIHYNGISIYCDRAEYNPETRDILLVGHVRIYNNTNFFSGERALYNLETKQIRGLELGGDFAPLKFRALSFNSVSQKEFRARDAFMTTSDSSSPDWGIRSRAMRIYNKDRVIFLNTTIYVGKVPIIWVPYMYASLKQSGIQIQPGYDSTWGGYLLSSYMYAIGNDDHLLTRIHNDYRSLRGYAIGLDVEDKFGKNDQNTGQFLSYYAWDANPNINNAPGQQRIVNPTSGNFEQRYRLTFTQKFYLKDDLYATADLTKLSDFTFMQNYYPVENAYNPQPDNNITFTKRNDDSTISLVTRWQMNNFQETTERLPELAFDFNEEPLFGLPLFYDGTTSIGQLQRSFAINSTNYPNYQTPSSYNATRFDTFHQLSLPQTLFGWLSLIPKIGMRVTAYNHGGDYQNTNGAITTFPNTPITSNGVITSTHANDLNWKGTTVRPIFNAGIEGSFKISRNFEGAQSRLLGLDGLRHVFQPYGNLSYVYAGGPNVNQVFQFDRYIPNGPNNLTKSGYQPSSTQLQPLNFPQFAAIDTIDTWTIMRIGVRNRLQTRRDEGTHDWFYIDSFIDINGVDPYRNGSVSNFNNRFTFNPISWLAIRLDSQVPVTTQGFTEMNLQFDIMPARWLEVSVGSAYINNYNGISGNQPSVSVQWKLTDHWSISATQLYNLNESAASNGTTTSSYAPGNSLLYQRYLINRDLSSWIVSLGADVRNNQGTPTQGNLTQYGAVIVCTLKDAPDVTMPFHLNAPTANPPPGSSANPLIPGN
jgi:lipopolysaccharide assembly outer membrane protein LptD (OstA)